MLITILLATLPTWAIGAFGPVSGPDGETAARALLIRDGDSTVAALQIDPRSSEAACTWIIPIPGRLESPMHQLDDGSLESLIEATDPVYIEGAEDIIGCDCTAGVSDTGTVSEIRNFDRQLVVDAIQAEVYGPAETEALLADIEKSGMDLSSESEAVIRGYADLDWSVALVRLGDGVGWSEASPLLVYRYSGDEVVVPMALSPHNTDDEMQTAVIIADTGRMNPTTSKSTKPRLGTPMYPSRMTREFYNARVRIAIDDAGGHAWVLEYANTLTQLEARVREFRQLLPPRNVDKVFTELQDAGMLSDDFGFDPIFITRWRTFASANRMVDERFGLADKDTTYEVFLDEDDFAYVSSATVLAPFFLMGWFRRRRAI
jgi:hypothetical protein